MIYKSDIKKSVETLGPVPMPEDRIYTQEEAHEFYRLQYGYLLELIEDIADRSNKYDRQRTNERNGKCPKCDSTKINDRIKRIQGSGRGSMSGSFLLGSGGFSGSSSFDMDTNEVNKCNNCEHEWKKRERNFVSENEAFGDLIFHPYYSFKEWQEDRAGSKKTAKTSWLKKEEVDTTDDRDAALAAAAQKKSDVNLLGFCKEVISTYFKENEYGDHKHRKSVLEMTDDQWKMWGGSIVQIEKPAVVRKAKSLWESLKFWK